ncbi:uncharacterized protein LOC110658932 isoform X2 [Hevea brasiliensis]|uniref:uncharacterized protein LOC110658932 isoform X2 n=1 Tax=Hevea brasiliensis TaxID=3981 RepID=UPI0025F6CA3A|nr:uncharacterized protein LOC110658932 isoform X2 [Hevea brasiliensis]
MDAVSSSQLKQTLLLLFAIHLLLPSIQATIVKYCDNKGNYDVKIHGVEISPDPVVPGNPATFNISASTAKSISGGKVDIYVSYFSVLVHKETHDLCEEISCPVKVGNFLLSHTQTLSGFTPPDKPEVAAWLNKPIRNYEKLCLLFGNDRAIGKHIETARDEAKEG